MTDIMAFTYENGEVRMVQIDGEPWWVLKDVCAVLDLTSPHKVADRLDDEEKGRSLIPTLGGEQEMAVVNESGLYSVILRSDKPEARNFKRWITREVLPSIRKHGLYATDALLRDPDLLIRILEELKSERAKGAALDDVVNIQRQQLAEMNAKSGYYDVVLNCKDAVSVTAIAKDYGKSARWLNELLHELGVQYKLNDIWLLYQKYAEKGYTCTKTHNYPASDGELHSKVHTYWTQKGRLFIYELLKSHGVLPLVERGQQLCL